ncbi:MAG TPA: DUF2877 domain-containing protein [Chloroflexota bacterium]
MHGVSLQALSYHVDLLGAERQLQVHAVFPRTWLLSGTDGTILTVTTSLWNAPLTVRVEGPSLERLEMEPGTPAYLTDAALEIGPVRIELRHAMPWKPVTDGLPIQIPALHQDIGLATQRAKVTNRGGLMPALTPLSGPVTSRSECVVVGAAPRGRPPSPRGRAGTRARQLPDNSQAVPPRSRQPIVTSEPAKDTGNLPARNGVPACPAWYRHALILLSELLNAIVREDDEAMARHAGGLIGLGPGLTPSGDDVLCGILTGLTVLGRRAPAHESRCMRARDEIAAAVLPRASSATTALSRTLLRGASRGIAVEPLLIVLCTLGSGSPVEGLDALLTLGHSSGSDMLAGAILSSTAVIRWEESFGPTLGGSP